MIELARTTDPVKLSALHAALTDGGVRAHVFDRAAGSLWQMAIPLRLMIDPTDEQRARRLLWDAGFAKAADGEWDLRDDAGPKRTDEA